MNSEKQQTTFHLSEKWQAVTHQPESGKRCGIYDERALLLVEVKKMQEKEKESDH